MEEFDAPSDPNSQLKLFLINFAKENDYKYTKDSKNTLLQQLSEFSGINLSSLEIDESNHNHYKRTCGHRFLRGETCWRCLTCGYDETCALCRFCYIPSDHIGHEVHKSIISRDYIGCCDCGDEEAYKNSQCPLYTTMNNADGNIFEETIDENVIEHLDTFFGILLDFIIDYTNHSVSSLSPSKRVDEIKLRHEMSFLNTKVYHEIDFHTEKYALVLYSDNVHQYRDAVDRIRFTTGKVNEFAEMVATRCNEHGRAIVMISNDIAYLITKLAILTSTGLVACIKNLRELFREEMCDDIIYWLYQFTQSNLFKGSEPIRSSLSRAFLSPYNSGCMQQWLDVFHGKVLLNTRCLRTDKNGSPIIKWSLPQSLKDDCQYFDEINDTDAYNGSRFQFLLLFDIRFSKTARKDLHNIYIPNIAKNSTFSIMLVAQFLDVYDKVFTLFLMVDREPELSVMPLLSTQLFSSPSKDILILKHQDAIKMIRTMSEYITTGETSTIRELQNLGDPIPNGILMSSLKNRKWAHILLDLTYIVTRNPDVENIFTFFSSFPDYVQFLSLFQSRPIFKREKTRHVEYENQDYTSFFNAVSVISHFSANIGKVLNRLSKMKLLSEGNKMDCYYHSYSKTMKKPYTETLYTIIIRKIIEICFTPTSLSNFNNNHPSPSFITEKEESIIFEQCKEFPGLKNVKFNVMEGVVSFLHPLHVMFSWMIEMDQSIDSEKSLTHIMDIIQGEYYYILNENSDTQHLPMNLPGESSNYEGVLAFFDIPLRKIVLLSQIKAGLWVRNGNSVKSQMNLYRNGSSREFGFSRDLFLCQYYVSYFRYAQLVTYTIFDRWNLLSWADNDYINLPYNVQYMQPILEEFILFIIYLVTEDLHLHKLEANTLSDLWIEREIVHSLCFENKSYNEIVSCIPDHICSQKRFPIVFKKCVEPIREYDDDDIYSEKVYKLKNELICSIDPYFVNFDSNRRENCLKKMKEYISLKQGLDILDVVIEPKEIDWSNSPFGKVVDILLHEKMLSFIFTTLTYCNTCIRKDGIVPENNIPKESCETLFSLSLHLTHIVLTHKNIMAVQPIELFRIFAKIYLNFKSEFAIPELKSKMRRILNMLYHILLDMNFDFSTELPNFDPNILADNDFGLKDNKGTIDLTFERKKKKAKKKRDKLMAKLKKQQLRFAENNITTDLDSNTGSETSSRIMRDTDSSQVSEIISRFDNLVDDTTSCYSGNDIMNDEEELDLINTDENNDLAWKFPDNSCLLCHNPANEENKRFGVFSYITESNVFRYIPTDDEYWFYKSFSGDHNLDVGCSKHNEINELTEFLSKQENDSVIGPGFPSVGETMDSPGYSDTMAVFTSCGHGMHDTCFKEFYASVYSKQFSQITRTTPENIQRREFICPLCKAINNIFIPVMYEKNDKKFHKKFENDLKVDDIVEHKFDTKLIKDNKILDEIKEELLVKVTESMKDKNWIIEQDVDENGFKKFIFSKDSGILSILKDTLITVTLLSPPFESFGLIITKTIEALEISLRGEKYNKKDTVHLLISHINNRSITGLRVWMQMSEFFKSSLSVLREDSPPKDNVHLYTQSLIGLYENLINDDSLLFEGQDYFAALIHCEEVLLLGYSFQKLVGIFFAKHIRQSILKIVLLFNKFDSGGSMKNWSEISKMKYLVSDTFEGNREHFYAIICNFFDYGVVTEGMIDLFYSMVIKLCTPFMRKTLIFAYAKYAVFQEQFIEIDDELTECDKICKTMKIPYVKDIIDELDIEFFNKIENKKIKKLQKSRIPYPGKIRLINLPFELNDFYIKYYLNLKEEERPADPAICLFCGKVVDCQKTEFGEEFGSCTIHLKWDCINEGRGIFLLPRNNCCLLLDNSKGTFIDSPYRDEYGEVDKDNKKGHDLILSGKRYEDLNKNIWLSHNIQNIIAQKLESLNDLGGWNTL